MCALCGILGAPDHWTDAVPRPGVFTRNTDSAARRRERMHRVAAANRILKHYRMTLVDWQGSSFVLWFLISAVVPVFGMLAAVVYRFENRELRRRCPGCGRVTKIYDAICTRCGTELDFPDTALAPEVGEHTAARS